MSNVAEFIEARKSIEALAMKIALCVEQHAAQDSRRHLDEANRQLEILKTMVANDVQVIVATRLSRQLAAFGVKIDKMPVKSSTRKKAANKKVTTPVRPEIEEVPHLVVFERP